MIKVIIKDFSTLLNTVKVDVHMSCFTLAEVESSHMNSLKKKLESQ